MTQFPHSNWAAQPWVSITSADLMVERRQCQEEGLDISALDDEFSKLESLELNNERAQQCAEALLNHLQTLPVKAGFAHREPSDLAGIQAERPAPVSLPTSTLDKQRLYDKALGGWQGRAAGCLLGKPVEGQRSGQMERYLKAQGRWPLERYFSNKSPLGIDQKDDIGHGRSPELFEEGIHGMPEDDDTNYTVTGLAILKQYGADFTPSDVAKFWLGNIPFYHVCTAERVAYRNLVMNIAPPASAVRCNPYREWIGAQIRADFFGYVNPGQPERAADFAWRDACISHVKNGIYGEMWVAAMLAAAYVTDDLETVIRAGLAQVPASCRLAVAIDHLIVLRHSGAGYQEAIVDLRARWDETKGHDWCHTISNAEIVTIALLWGEKDFGKTICYSVMPGFDTDCNGATSGSVLGVLLGAQRLPAQWIAPLNDTLFTGVAGYHQVALSRMAEETVGMMKL